MTGLWLATIVAFSISLMNGSFRKAKTVNSVVAKMTDKSNNTVTIVKWTVSDADCRQKYGKLVVTDISTAKVQWTNDFAFGGGSVGSNVAELICAVGDSGKPAVTM